MKKIKDILKQETFVINNPGPKLLSFIRKMQANKDKIVKETKNSYIRNGFISNDSIDIYYDYKDYVASKVNLNNKYNLSIFDNDYPEDETINKIDDVLSILNIPSGIMLDVVVIKNNRNEYQLFTVYNNGTNQGDGNILKPMKKMVNILEKLQDNEHVSWCQILDTYIDNMDDVYSWYITIILK